MNAIYDCYDIAMIILTFRSIVLLRAILILESSHLLSWEGWLVFVLFLFRILFSFSKYIKFYIITTL